MLGIAYYRWVIVIQDQVFLGTKVYLWIPELLINGGGNPGGFPGSNITTHNTNVQITRPDGTWSDTIRSLFVYGTGGARFWVNLSRGGTPAQRGFIIGSTIVAESVGHIIKTW